MNAPTHVIPELLPLSAVGRMASPDPMILQPEFVLSKGGGEKILYSHEDKNNQIITILLKFDSPRGG